jgi:uncharacterized membrane protein YedE/YeeE
VTEFTPVSSLAGGALIGIAATVLLWLDGRIAGISGIVGGLLRRPPGDTAWRLAFVVGLLGGGVMLRLLAPAQVAFTLERSTAVLIIAGLLVGYGTQLGSGCTSGHGVCGLSRGSRRSLVATLTFMATGALTVLAVRLLGGAP